MQKAYFGAGCFWGVEARFKEVPGVEDTTVGYGGGKSVNPSYEDVCDGNTGHAELVEVVFDETTVSFAQLVKVFFGLHNPTTKNRQGLDVGSQYRSAIFTMDDSQAETAASIRDQLDEEGAFNDPIVTEIEPFTNFYAAEEYHQDYLDKNPGMCHI